MVKGKKLGLALSGGGYRAAAFHLGTLRKLKQMNILGMVDVVSTISGGSIAGVYYALHKDNFKAFEDGLEGALQKSVIRRIIFSVPVIALVLVLIALLITIVFFTWKSHGISYIVIVLLTIVLLLFLFQFTFLPFTKLKIKAYRRLFFDDKRIRDLPLVPKIAINATNLETGTLWTYSKDKVSDSSYEYPKDGKSKIVFNGSEIPLAMAVASSTCVPVPFSPVKIPKKYFACSDDYQRCNPSLSDGGLYDNQGIHKLTEAKSSYACDIIICSDGSQPFQFKFKGLNSFGVLYRANDVMMRKIKSLQFIRDVYGQKYEVAYFSLDWQYEACITGFISNIANAKIAPDVLAYHNLNALWLADIKTYYDQLVAAVKANIDYDGILKAGVSVDDIKAASLIPTGLSAFNKPRIDLLSKHAAALTEMHIKLYCPSLLT